MGNAAECIFGNVEVLLPAKLTVLKQEATRMELDDLSTIFKFSNAVLGGSYCYTPERVRPCRKAALHVASPPCPSFSSCGEHAGAVGPLLLPLLVWTAQRSTLEEEYVLHENAPGFLVSLLEDMLGSISTPSPSR